MNEEDYKERAKRQFDKWRNTWVRGTGSEDPDPIYPYGHMIKYLIEPDHTPYLDFMGGGGFAPHGHSNQVIGVAIQKMAGQAWQTSDKGDHCYSATAEFMTKVEEHLPFAEPHWRFTSSENEAVSLLLDALAEEYDHVVVVNGPSGWPCSGVRSTLFLSVDSQLFNVPEGDKVAVVVHPVNPESFAVVDQTTLAVIESLRSQREMLVVWDLSVSAGWTREPLDVPPDADAVILGGALGGGLPFGAVVSRKPFNFPLPGRWSATAGNALVCQLGLHALLLTEGEEARDEYDTLAAAIGREIENLTAQLPSKVVGVTGGGLLGGIVLESVSEAQRVVDGLKEKGVLVGTLGISHRVVTFMIGRKTNAEDVSELFDKMFDLLTDEEDQ